MTTYFEYIKEDKNEQLYLFSIIDRLGKYSIKKIKSVYLNVTKSSEQEIIKMLENNISYLNELSTKNVNNEVIHRALKQARIQLKKFRETFK
ncbi:MAG: hypothetical protein PHC28_05865 [Flavobacterium sp.]|uniref:hypothetical protein n=1 Tax=Flavobacterium sp. TaxID=239 RepID=UPI00262DB90C|nr:hypothetical protein [Flavobacterium sp.]MDD5149995.1 hypothetical protein [Flavobacterium sp.]